MIRRVSSASLPYVDERAVEVGAGAAQAWDAVGAVMGRDAGSRAVAIGVRVLGCREREASGSPTETGGTFPGFRVAESARPSTLVYEGEHRFSRYRLAFHVDELGPGRARVRAETRAAFPGLVGAAYRAMVIGSRGHVVAVRRMLRAIRRRAEAAA
jgi:hypothetical protein